MDLIRKIKAEDYPLLTYAWARAGDRADSRDIYPEHSSYVVERDGKLLYCVAVYKVEGVPVAFAEGLILNPFEKADFKAVRQLQAHIEKAAKSMGCKVLIAISKNEGLTRHHRRLGYNKVSAGAFMAKGL